MLQDLEKYLHESQSQPNKINVLTQLASTVAFAVNSDHWNVFIYDNISNVSQTLISIYLLSFDEKIIFRVFKSFQSLTFISILQ